MEKHSKRASIIVVVCSAAADSHSSLDSSKEIHICEDWRDFLCLLVVIPIIGNAQDLTRLVALSSEEKGGWQNQK